MSEREGVSLRFSLAMEEVEEGGGGRSLGKSPLITPLDQERGRGRQDES